MFESVSYKAYDPNPVLARGQTLQLPPEGTRAAWSRPRSPTGPGPRRRCAPAASCGTRSSPRPPTCARPARSSRPSASSATARRDRATGRSSAASRTRRACWPTAPRRLPDGQVFHIISRGQGIMPSHAAQVLPDDRWRVILYLRQLQGAQQGGAAVSTDRRTSSSPSRAPSSHAWPRVGRPWSRGAAVTAALRGPAAGGGLARDPDRRALRTTLALGGRALRRDPGRRGARWWLPLRRVPLRAGAHAAGARRRRWRSCFLSASGPLPLGPARGDRGQPPAAGEGAPGSTRRCSWRARSWCSCSGSGADRRPARGASPPSRASRSAANGRRLGRVAVGFLRRLRDHHLRRLLGLGHVARARVVQHDVRRLRLRGTFLGGIAAVALLDAAARAGGSSDAPLERAGACTTSASSCSPSRRSGPTSGSASTC